ncbi:MAG: hypothetical protein JWO30_4849 [Fibrobacteres bacterium]|nr:hypothetical protein [Fibrobacterota bacterium]
MKPDIFTYLEYRVFLKDAFEAVKAGSPKLSYRTFAKKAGFSSPNFLQMVMQGKRNLSSTYAISAAKAFKLNRQETEFFQNLVGYDQAKSLDEKNLFYQKILKNKRYTTVKTLDKSQYEFFSHWYIPVVREMLTHKDFTGESAWIAERVYPRITAAQVDSAKDLLLKLGMIRQEAETGKWTLADAVISTESEATHLALRNYHMSAIQLAHDCLKVFSPTERDVRSVTIGLSESAFAELKARLETVWKEVLDFAGTQQQADAVYQVNLQLFPLTRERKL